MKRLALIAVLGWSAIAAQAAVIDFDTVTTDNSYYTGWIPNGYAGFNWDNFAALDTVNYVYNPSGYQTALSSGDKVAFDGYGGGSSFYVSTGEFNLLGMQAAAAWNDGLELNIIGYLGATEKYNRTFTLTTTTRSSLDLNFMGIDRVAFLASGGTPNQNLSGSGNFFGMDDVRVSTGVPAVPEPFTMGLAALGLGAALKRRRK